MITITIGKCQVQVYFSCFALLAFCCIFNGMGGGAACFLAVILHECAHLAAMWVFGVYASQVTLTALGCRVVPSKGKNLPDCRQAVVSLAGPGVNLLCFLLALALGAAQSTFAGASLALGIAHSLPIEPLDGGLALRYLLRARLGGPRAEKLSRMLSALFLFPLAVLGFLVLLHTRYNYSLLALSVYLMLYLVLGRDYAQP
ncbi:hypothetical protein [Acutalibacter caecimuris]|uniref:hypothetical protein n=1 Tax=Acutalibacter caecimuris TaxID=3093657 RepID=UPI002AC8C7AC|nr:hypothetical protein [Acutalibacter sp. M00118]